MPPRVLRAPEPVLGVVLSRGAQVSMPDVPQACAVGKAHSRSIQVSSSRSSHCDPRSDLGADLANAVSAAFASLLDRSRSETSSRPTSCSTASCRSPIADRPFESKALRSSRTCHSVIDGQGSGSCGTIGSSVPNRKSSRGTTAIVRFRSSEPLRDGATPGRRQGWVRGSPTTTGHRVRDIGEHRRISSLGNGPAHEGEGCHTGEELGHSGDLVSARVREDGIDV